jgi:hypothetical protein
MVFVEQVALELAVTLSVGAVLGFISGLSSMPEQADRRNRRQTCRHQRLGAPCTAGPYQECVAKVYIDHETFTFDDPAVADGARRPSDEDSDCKMRRRRQLQRRTHAAAPKRCAFLPARRVDWISLTLEISMLAGRDFLPVLAAFVLLDPWRVSHFGDMPDIWSSAG